MENLSIFNITTGINWMKNKQFYYTINEEYALIMEYLNIITLPYIDDEIKKLERFIKVSETKDKVKIEDYIMTTLYGFSQYNDGKIYAYIAGVTDQGVSVLYDLETNETLLKHVYGEPYETFFIKISTLIKLLEQSKAILSLLTALRSTD